MHFDSGRTFENFIHIRYCTSYVITKYRDDKSVTKHFHSEREIDFEWNHTYNWRAICRFLLLKNAFDILHFLLGLTFRQEKWKNCWLWCNFRFSSLCAVNTLPKCQAIKLFWQCIDFSSEVVYRIYIYI